MFSIGKGVQVSLLASVALLSLSTIKTEAVTASPVLWLRADEGITESVDGISQWTDQSGSGTNAVQTAQSSQPQVSGERYNFHPGIELQEDNRGGTYFDIENKNELPSGAEGRTYFIVTDPDESQGVGTHSLLNHGSAIEGGFIGLSPLQNSTGFRIGAGYHSFRNNLVTEDTAIFTVSLPENANSTEFEMSVNGLDTLLFENQAGDDHDSVIIDTNNFGPANIGYAQAAGTNYNGDVLEVIAYDTELTAIEQQQVQSYLALKYGLQLDQTNSTDYLNSNGDVIWESTDNTYTSGVTGIGRDDAFSLNQKISKSTEDGSIMTISLDTDFTSNNNDSGRTATHANNLQHAILAHNNEAITAQMTEMDSEQHLERISREWKAALSSNFTDQVNIKFDGFNEDYTLIKDMDGDFSTGSEQITELNTNGIAEDVVLEGEYYYTLVMIDENYTPPAMDNDGVDEIIENGAPNNGDGNNDGILDSEQEDVASLPTVTGQEYITIDGQGCELRNINVGVSTADEGFEYPFGVVNFEGDCASLDVEIILHTTQEVIPRKLNNGSYATIESAQISNIVIDGQAAQKITYTVTDGGELDLSPAGDGRVVDPLGFGVMVNNEAGDLENNGNQENQDSASSLIRTGGR